MRVDCIVVFGRTVSLVHVSSIETWVLLEAPQYVYNYRRIKCQILLLIKSSDYSYTCRYMYFVPNDHIKSDIHV